MDLNFSNVSDLIRNTGIDIKELCKEVRRQEYVQIIGNQERKTDNCGKPKNTSPLIPVLQITVASKNKKECKYYVVHIYRRRGVSVLIGLMEISLRFIFTAICLISTLVLRNPVKI